MAAEMVMSNDGSAIEHAVGQVGIAEVARETGRSRAALYKMWDSQQDFRVDLAVYMVATTHEPLLPEWFAFDPRDEFVRSAREGFEGVLDRQIEIQEDHAFRASLLAYPDQAGVRSRCAAIERVVRGIDARHLTKALGDVGRRVSEPLTAFDLVTLLRCVADAQILVGRRNAENLELLVPADPQRPSRLFPYVAGCLLEHLTEPGAPGDGTEPLGQIDPAEYPEWTERQHEVLETAASLARSSLRSGTASRISALGHLTIDRVARAVGEHRRTLYRCWPDHDALRLAVLWHLVERQRVRYYKTFDRAAAAGLAHPERLTMTMVDQITGELYEFEDPAPIARFALFGYTGLPEVTEQAQIESRAHLEAIIPRIDAMLEFLAWRPRNGLTARQLSAMIGLFSLGGERMHHMDPTAIRRDLPYLDGHYSSIAIAHHAVETASIDKSSTN